MARILFLSFCYLVPRAQKGYPRAIDNPIHANKVPNRAPFIPNYRPQQIYTDRKHQKLMPRRNVDGRVLHEVPTGQYSGDRSDMGGK